MDEVVKVRRRITVFRRVVLPFVIIAVLNCVLLVALLMASGIFNSMFESSLSILGESTQTKGHQLENSMLQWMDWGQMDKQLCAIISKGLREAGKTEADMANDPALNNMLVNQCKDELLEYLQLGDQNGIFLILDGIGIPGEPDSKAGIFLYDSEPNGYVTGNADISLLRGLPPLSRELGITLHSYWEAGFNFSGEASNPDNDYYYKPMLAYLARSIAKTSASYFGYWCPDFFLSENDGDPIISYSQPLVSEGGAVYGVLGISVTVDSLAEAMGMNTAFMNVQNDNGCLAITSDGGVSYQTVTAVGDEYLTNFGSNAELAPTKITTVGSYDYMTMESQRTGEKYFFSIYPLKLYSNNTPFQNMQWSLLTMRHSDKVFALEGQFRQSVLLTVFLSLAIGLGMAFWLARGIARPITRLVRELNETEEGNVARVEGTGIVEVDKLAQTIIEQKQRAVEEASRISKIILLSGLPIGVFEWRQDNPEVFCSDGFFKLLNYQQFENGHNQLPVQQFAEMMVERFGGVQENDDVYCLKDGDETRYIRLHMLNEIHSTIGTLMDVTEEIENRKKLEHERDFDLLTNIYNRRAFENKVTAMFNANADCLHPVSALVMADLDNLKAVNDSNGHDGGDQYIREFAAALEKIRTKNCLVGRRSGDEFYMFFYGYQSREELMEIIQQGWKDIRKQTVVFSDGQSTHINASAGVAWFPEDAVSFKQLLHYADFAMYRVKNTVKGNIITFDREDYSQTGYMLNGIQALNRMLEQTLVRYAYQPIVNARNGNIIGYEMLMRPQVEELQSPQVVLNLAREQGMSHLVESMTWRAALADVASMERQGKLPTDTALFINTITNQMMSPEEETYLFKRYQSIMHRVVVEITEFESPDKDAVKRKVHIIRGLGGKIAIDDFGSGYNSDLSLISVDTDYLKLDKTMIRNIHMDLDRRDLVSNIILFAHQRQMQVVAEGVESGEEMRTLAQLNVDYFQGFYLAYPAFVPPVISEKVLREIEENNASRAG